MNFTLHRNELLQEVLKRHLNIRREMGPTSSMMRTKCSKVLLYRQRQPSSRWVQVRFSGRAKTGKSLTCFHYPQVRAQSTGFVPNVAYCCCCSWLRVCVFLSRLLRHVKPSAAVFGSGVAGQPVSEPLIGRSRTQRRVMQMRRRRQVWSCAAAAGK